METLKHISAKSRVNGHLEVQTVMICSFREEAVQYMNIH